MLRKSPRLLLGLFLVDITLLLLAFLLGYYLRFRILGSLPGHIPPLPEFVGAAIFVLLVWVAIFKTFGLYEEENIAISDEGVKLLAAISSAMVLFLALLFVYRRFWFSRQVILYAWIFSFGMMFLARTGFVFLQQLLFRRGWFTRDVVIFGTGEEATTIRDRLDSQPGLGYRVKGHCRARSELQTVLKGETIGEVIIADRTLSSAELLDLITEHSLRPIRFRIVPGLIELLASRVSLSELGEIPLVTIREVGLTGLPAFLKRTVDILVSVCLIILLCPLLVTVGLLVRLTSPGPIFFRQARVGIDGRPFEILKFRSMVVGAEELEPDLRQRVHGKEPIFKLKDDPRLTPVGRWLRRWSIDELPQLLNVLRGEMSLVGPRPPLSHEVEKYSAWERKRLRVRPGITGLWQVSGRSDLSFQEMIKLDIYYIENWALWFDLKILARTIPAVLLRRGAY